MAQLKLENNNNKRRTTNNTRVNNNFPVVLHTWVLEIAKHSACSEFCQYTPAIFLSFV